MRKDYESENENALWRTSIKMMFQAKDLDGLKDLLEGPEVLDQEIIDFLKECIDELQNEKGKSQVD